MYSKKELLDHTKNIKSSDEMKKMNREDLFLPYVGEGYRDKLDKTYLLVMESHYLPKYFNGLVKDVSKFYSDETSFYNNIKMATAVEDEVNLMKALEYCYSAKIFSNVIDDFKNEENKTHPFYKTLYNLIQFSGINIGEIEKQFAIMNYYQRPAVASGDSIAHNDDDNIFAYENLLKIKNILKPDYIIFASIKAGNVFYHTKKNHWCLDNKKSIEDETDNYFKDNGVFIVKHLANRAVATREYSKFYKNWYKKMYQDEFKGNIKNSEDILTYIFKKKE